MQVVGSVYFLLLLILREGSGNSQIGLEYE